MTPLFARLFWLWDEDKNNEIWDDEGEFEEQSEKHHWETEIDIWDAEENIAQIALDVLENNEGIYILAPVAGIKLHDIDISVHDTTLVISGIRQKPKEFYTPGMQVKNSECFWGKFMRKIVLPESMDFSQIKAVMEQNLLVVYIPKIRFSSQNIRIEKVGEYF